MSAAKPMTYLETLRARHHMALPLLVLALSACQGDARDGARTAASGTPAVSPSTSSSAKGSESSAERLDALHRAELMRSVTVVTKDDLTNRSVSVRRATARALARMRHAAAHEGLLQLLRDPDDQVVAWAAYGLGDDCAGHRDATVSALVATASVRPESVGAAASDRGISSTRALVRAVGRCAGSVSEATLVGWARARGPFSTAAMHALGDVAKQRKRLREESYVALLKLAEGDAAAAPLHLAFYPLGRVEHLTPSVLERTREVALKALGMSNVKGKQPEATKPAKDGVQAEQGLIFAVRALGRSDDQALPALRDIIEDASRPAAVRVEAARGAGRFGRKGQRALAAALSKLVPEAAAMASERSPQIGVLLTVLGGLTEVRRARKPLRELAELAVPKDASAAVKRRFSLLRCQAARLLVERDFNSVLLRGCDLAIAADEQAIDPLPGVVGARAVVGALGVDGARIRGKRLVAWRKYALEGPLLARQDAIKVLATHDEIRDASAVLRQALEAPQPGLVAAAAALIAKHPARATVAGRGRGPVDPKLLEALLKHLEGNGPAKDIEALVAVMQAVATLAPAEAKNALGLWCRAPHAVVRAGARRALVAIMGRSARACDQEAELALPNELQRLETAKRKLIFETDAGTLQLELDPAVAPLAVTRALDLAKAGAFTGLAVHRVAPGFVAQFGSPTGDGFGQLGDGPVMPCETSPRPFGLRAVGVALAGRDTGASQFFVTLAASPQLDGRYPQIGLASGPWDALVEGDLIRSVKVE